MAEHELKTNIEDYKTQLSAIEEALTVAQTEDSEELIRLKQDLTELLALTEEQLLDLKKKQLIHSFEDPDPNKNEAANCSAADSEEDSMDLEDHLDQLVGSRCRAPFGTKFGHRMPLAYHNAVILDLIFPPTGNLNSLEELKVTVLYCNPMFQKMQPCKFFLQNRCNFHENCKFSHGEIVDFKDLLEYLEPNFQLLKEEGLCLVKKDSSEEIWELGEITGICHQEQRAAVKLKNSEKEVAVPFEDIFPLLDAEKIQDISTDLYPENLGIMGNFDSGNTWLGGALGDWEMHTKGIGSKLMAKMGYILGEGLGRDSSGKVEPVEAKILPKGKSLDHCMEKRKNKDPLLELKKAKKKERKKNERLAADFLRNSTEVGIFDFLNKKLAQGPNFDEVKNSANLVNSPKNMDLKLTSTRDLNVQLLEIQEKHKRLAIDMVRWKECLLRNEGKDEGAAGKFRNRLAQAEDKILELNRREKRIQNEQVSRKEKKKSTVF